MAPYIQHNSGPNWKRNNDYGGQYDSSPQRGAGAYWGLIGDRTPRHGTEAFAFWMGFAVLATIVPAALAFIVCPPFTAKY